MAENQDSWCWKFRRRWLTDVFDGAMALRLQEWELIDDTALERTAAWAREAIVTHEEEFELVVLNGLMRLLSLTWGDPPVTPELAAAVPRYLALPPDDELAAAAEPLIRQFAPGLDGTLDSIQATRGEAARRQAWQVLGGIALRLAVPRVDLLRMTGRLSRAPAGPDPFGTAFQAGIDCARTDPRRSERHLRHALLLAGAEEAPGDCLLVIRTLLHRPGGGLEPDTLLACAEQLRGLAGAGLDGDQVAREAGRAAAQANAAGLAPELFPVLAETNEKLLQGAMSADGRVRHALETAEWWLRTGRLDRCDLVLSKLRDEAGSLPGVMLGSGRIEAEMRRLCADRSGAWPLAAALGAAEGEPAAPADRARAIIELLFCWPVEPGPAAGQFGPRPEPIGQRELAGWYADAERCISLLSPRSQNNLRVSLLAALLSIGAGEQAGELSARTDLSRFATQSADYSQWSAEFVDWARRRLAGEKNLLLPGDSGKTYADLAEEERFAEAAEEAAVQAAVQERRGFRVDAYDTLVRCAQLHVEAGDWAAALAAYDHAFALLERDLRYVPYVELVTRRLAAWPSLYQQAAVLALRVGDPERAVTLAETGRARATASRLGRAHPARPPAVTEDDWDEFTRLWRHAVAEAASDLFTPAEGTDAGDDSHRGRPPAPRGTPGTDSAGPSARLNRLRRAFLEAGVAPQDLAPVAPPADVSGVPAGLALAGRPTAVLYPVQIRNPGNQDRDTIRFVRISGSGVTEIPVEPADRTEIARLIEEFGADVRAGAQDPPSLITGLVDGLGPRLEPVLSQAVAGLEDGRLIWIPPGPAASVPVAALPCRGARLIDLVSVIVAPSLAAVADAVARDAARPLRGVVLEGPPGDGAGTDGGDLLLGDGSPVFRPASLADVSGAAGAAPVVYLSCHGRFRWDRPLSSGLQFGTDARPFELSVADIFDATELSADTLILLGACDSGTIAQTDLNEGIGLPAAFLAAGARAVIGASWPVRRGVTVGICLAFLRGLRQGQASPEALRDAVRWIRDATIADVDEELAAIRHPLYRGAPASEAQAAVRRQRPVAALADWASYVHWGSGWIAVPGGAGSPGEEQGQGRDEG